MSIPRPLESLITAYLDGQLSAAEERELRGRLKSDAEARKLFLSLVDLHATLLGDKLLAGQVTAVKLPGLATEETSVEKIVAFPGETKSPAGWRVWASVAAVLALLLTALLYQQYTRTPAAEIVRMAGAKFAQSGTAFTEGQSLRREACVLERGSLELRTAKGVTLVIEAPAEFRFESAQRMHLVRGRLSADVPPAGKGFTVVTPSGKVVDLGTRFGVDITDKNSAEVHVFKGEVIAQAGQAAKKQSLKEDQALTLNAGQATPRELRNAAFIRADEVELLAGGLRAGQQARWTQSLAELSRDPALVSLLNLDQPTGVYRPAQGRWPGARAVEFTQPGDYLAVEFQGETEELTLAAWVRLDRVPHAINSLLHTDGWGKPGQPHWMVAENQRMRFAIYDVRSVDQREEKYPQSSRKVTAATGRWTHLATVYRAREKTVRFYIDGEFDNEVAVLTGIPVVLGPARVGNWNRQDRILSGRLDELVVLRRALDDEAVKKLFAAGNPYQ